MATPFQVEVLTPDGEVFNEEVTMVSTKTAVGSIGILAKHEPLLAMLDPTELRLYRSESEVVRYAQGEGYLQVAHDGHVLVLLEEAHEIDKLDVPGLEQQLRRAEEELSQCEEGSARHGSLVREKRRFEVFLGIARGGH